MLTISVGSQVGEVSLQITQRILVSTRLLHIRGMTNNLKFVVSPTCVAIALEEENQVLLNDLREPAILFVFAPVFFLYSGQYLHHFCIFLYILISHVYTQFPLLIQAKLGFIEFRQAFMFLLSVK